MLRCWQPFIDTLVFSFAAQVATDLQRATGTADADSADSNRLNRVLQLTGE
jgi:hypothetical protein